MKFVVIFIFIQGIFPSLAQGGECEKSFNNLVFKTHLLTEQEIKNLTRLDISSLPINEIQNFTTEQIPLFTPEQIQSFDPDHQIPYFLPKQVRAFTKEQLQAFTPEQIQFFSYRNLRNLEPEQFASFTKEQLQALTYEHIQTLHFAQVKHLSPKQLLHFSSQKFRTFRDFQMAGLDTKHIGELIYTDKIKQLKPEVHEMLINKWIDRQVKMMNDAIDNLTDEEIRNSIKGNQ